VQAHGLAVEAVAATDGDIGVTVEDLAMGRPHAADRLMALSKWL